MRILRYQNSHVLTPAVTFPGLADELDRLFAAAFPSLGYSGTSEFPIDLYREKDSFIARAELPGFRKEDLNVQVADGLLTITGHRKVQTPDEGENEGTTTQDSRVTRTVPLPEQVKVEAIAAKYENGVLTVTLPKQEEAKPKQITIEVK